MAELPDAVHLKIRRLGIGDTVTATSLVRDLKALAPDIRISVSGREIDSVFEHDPRIGPRAPGALEVEVDYKKTLYRARTDPTANYVLALHDDFELKTGIRVPRGAPVPSVTLAPHETRPIREPYCVVAAGVKGDILVKNWGPSNFAKVVRETKDWNWIQVGDIAPAAIGNYQVAIPDATNKLGHTSVRDLIVLIAHADLVLCHVSVPMLLAGAFGVPCVAVLGGREPPTLFSGLGVTVLDTIGKLPCCEKTGCLAACALPGRAPEEFPPGWLCSAPVTPDDGIPVGRCMTLIDPKTVVDALRGAKFGAGSRHNYSTTSPSSGVRRSLPVLERIHGSSGSTS